MTPQKLAFVIIAAVLMITAIIFSEYYLARSIFALGGVFLLTAFLGRKKAEWYQVIIIGILSIAVLAMMFLYKHPMH